MKILAIESSCDETAAAVVEDGRKVLSDVVASQIEIHRRFGGVVPEIASRNHTLAIDNVVGEALKNAGCGREEIDAVAVTYGAGLLGALLVGVNYAKGLAYAWKKPLYAVSHVKGHLAANYIDSGLEPPYLCLLASGGHTAVLQVADYEDTVLIGQSRDDAAGEAFDKVARVLGLPYPGGPEIQKLALDGSPVYKMPLPVFKEGGEINFSYSGLKTFVINLVHGMEQRGEEIPRADIAASFQECAVEPAFPCNGVRGGAHGHEKGRDSGRREREREVARAHGGLGKEDGSRDILSQAPLLHGQRRDDRGGGVLSHPFGRGARRVRAGRESHGRAVSPKRAASAHGMRAACVRAPR